MREKGWIRHMAGLTAVDTKESERLKREAYGNCVRRIKDFLSPEQLQEFEEAFFNGTKEFIFREKKG